ncbi:MAG TPA: zinc ribbon domain-containing protein [Gemmatimonadaceae bacterium]|nr:zinc ribbon domain-containing protein [Gemmatimonadaceae bacterium]
MIGLAVGAVLSLGAAAWVIAPLVRAESAESDGEAAGEADGEADGDVLAPGGDRDGPARCPACGAPPEADARFCSTCGRPIVSPPGVSPASS